MAFNDYYRTLGVARDADTDTIKRAYRKQARKYHPDVSREPRAEERFKEIQQAWEVLKDPDKRAAYDRYGSNWQHGADFQPPPDWGADIDFGDYQRPRDFAEFFDSLFGDGGRTGGRARQAAGRGEDLQARVAISLEDAVGGTSRNVTLQVPQAGPGGRMVTRSKTLSVKIPAGVTAGQRIRLAGQGAPGRGHAPPGDLYLEIALLPHRLYRVEGRDLHLDLPIVPWEAALGASVTVPMPTGRVDVARFDRGDEGTRAPAPAGPRPARQAAGRCLRASAGHRAATADRRAARPVRAHGPGTAVQRPRAPGGGRQLTTRAPLLRLRQRWPDTPTPSVDRGS